MAILKLLNIWVALKTCAQSIRLISCCSSAMTVSFPRWAVATPALSELVHIRQHARPAASLPGAAAGRNGAPCACHES
jgi:hypothetical protein